jgi:NADH-quinone oxidoreductase subunit M
MSTTPFPFLTVLILVPAIGAAVVALVPTTGVARWFHEALGIAIAAVTLVIAIATGLKFRAGYGGYQLVSDHTWAKDLGIHWSLGIDGISLFLVGLTALLVPLCLLGARARRDPRSFVAWVLVMEAACLGSFVSLDLLLFFLFFELTLVPAYFLIGGWGFARRGYAAIKFFVYTFAGSAFLLVGILSIAFLHQSQTGVLTFELPALMHTHVSGTEGVLLFLAFTAAFAVKAPIFPFHTWSPDAYAEAPTAGAVLLSAVMAKLGTYGIIRFDLNLFPQATRTLAPLLLTLAVIGILYGALVACAQRDMKRLLAYSSLAQIGFIVLGTFALNSQGLTGGVLQMVNHGLIIATLFILVGWIYERRKTWQVSGLRGLQGPAPVMAGVFTVAMLASIGVPGLNGFVGEFLVLIGTFVAHRWWAVVGIGGIIIAAIYLLWAYQQVFHGEPTAEDTARTRDLVWSERLIIAPLIVLIVFLGVYPKPVLDRITPSVNELIVHVDQVTHHRIPADLLPASAARPPAASHHPAAVAIGVPAATGAAGTVGVTSSSPASAPEGAR